MCPQNKIWRIDPAGDSSGKSMPKKKVHIEARTQEERIEQRKPLGSLRSLTVQPAMKKRYYEALSKFFDFLTFEGLALPKQKYHIDILAAEYIEDVRSSGEGGALASDTGAGLQNLEPHLKGRLATVWRWLKVWSQNELPNRAPPMPESVVHAIAGRAILSRWLWICSVHPFRSLWNDEDGRTFNSIAQACGSF